MDRQKPGRKPRRKNGGQAMNGNLYMEVKAMEMGRNGSALTGKGGEVG